MATNHRNHLPRRINASTRLTRPRQPQRRADPRQNRDLEGFRDRDFRTPRHFLPLFVPEHPFIMNPHALAIRPPLFSRSGNTMVKRPATVLVGKDVILRRKHQIWTHAAFKNTRLQTWRGPQRRDGRSVFFVGHLEHVPKVT